MRIWEKTLFLNKDIEYLINDSIIEYDIKSGGFNVCKKFKLLPPDKIEKLEGMNKKDRQIQLGWYQKWDKTLSKRMNEGFKECRRLFFEANHLKDEDTLSIKKDAIFTLKECEYRVFGNIEFRPKNNYTSYYLLNDKEFYYNRNTLDVKGISDENLLRHKEYMLNFLSNIFRCFENSSEDFIRKTLREFADYYKNRALEIGYYRELNEWSVFRIMDEYLFDDNIGLVYTNEIGKIDIRYNYINYIIPLIRLLV